MFIVVAILLRKKKLLFFDSSRGQHLIRVWVAITSVYLSSDLHPPFCALDLSCSSPPPSPPGSSFKVTSLTCSPCIKLESDAVVQFGENISW